MKQEIKISEINLIREWKNNNNQDIALYFFNKYKDDVLNIIFDKINRKFSSIPLEKGDFFHIVWKSVLNVLKDYKLTKGGSFKDLLTNNAYFNCVREALKFIRNNHIVLNNAYSYEKLLETNKNYDFGNKNKTTIDSDFNLVRNKFINEVIELNKKFNIKFLKRVVYLKSLGYSTKDISKKMRRPHKLVRAAVEFMIKVAKKLYY